MTERDQKIIENMHLVESIIDDYIIDIAIERDDALSIGYEILIDCIDKNIKHMEMSLKRRIHTALKKEASKTSAFIVNNTINADIDDNISTEFICEVLNTLTERECRVIEYRFFNKLTLEEVGKLYNLTGNRIRQIEAKALRKLRHPSRAKFLRGFYGVASR